MAASGHHGLIQGEVLLLDEHYSVGADREEGLEDQRKVGFIQRRADISVGGLVVRLMYRSAEGAHPAAAL